MRIGFDISQTCDCQTDYGCFTDGLVRSLAEYDKINKYVLYATFGDSFWGDSEKVSKINQDNFSYGLSHISLKSAKAFWQNISDEQTGLLGGVDIIHCNNFFCPTKLTKTKIVYTLYDLSCLTHPDNTTEYNRIAHFNGLFNASLNADHIIAVSDSLRKLFLDTFPYFPKDKISVIYLASLFGDDDKKIAERVLSVYEKVLADDGANLRRNVRLGLISE